MLADLIRLDCQDVPLRKLLFISCLELFETEQLTCRFEFRASMRQLPQLGLSECLRLVSLDQQVNERVFD